MELKIYPQKGEVKAAVSPSSSSQWTREVSGENSVSLSFKTWACFMLDVNDYIMVGGHKFKIKKEYRPKQLSTQEYAYQASFYGREHDAEDLKLCRLTQGEDDLEVAFAYEATPLEMLAKVVQNLNRNTDGTVWKVGEAVDLPRRTFQFNDAYCWDALGDIASQLETEWWIDGDYLNLCKCERGEQVSLGYLQGLTSLTQQENTGAVKFFTRLIPRGSTKNIDRSSYGYDRLQLPSRARFIDLNTQYGLKEHVEEAAFEGIYPHRVGTLSAVRQEERENEQTGKFTVYYVKDADIPFNPDDCMLGEEVMHLTFRSGNLQGKDFEVNWHNGTQEFEIINTYPDEATQLPGGNLVPAPGDTYILWNLRMPAAYLTQAELDYEAAVNDFLAGHAHDTSIYAGGTDYIYIEKNKVPLQLGQRARLLSAEYFGAAGYRDSRMTRVACKLENLDMATIECCNAVGRGWKSSVESSLDELRYTIAEQQKQGTIKILKSGDSESPSEYNVFSALRSFREFLCKKYPGTAQEVITFIKGILLGKKGHGISVSDSNVVTAILDELKNVFTIVSPDFASGDLGNGFILKYDKESGRSYLEVDELLVRKLAYFVELVIKRLSYVGGEIILTPASMKCSKVETHNTYYRCYFEQDDGERSIMQEFRAGDQARCQTFNMQEGVSHNVSNSYYWRLVTNVGKNYIDLSIEDCDAGSMAPSASDHIVQLGNRGDTTRQNAIILSTVGDDAPSFKQYKGIDSYSLAGKEVTVVSPALNKFIGKFISSATGKDLDDSIRQIAIDLDLVKEQADKEYTMWFDDYIPTLDNAPASEWDTDELKDIHVQDIFYNTSKKLLEGGRSFRFEHNADGSYSWNEITDHDTIKALEDAAKAQDTADGKRRIFVEQPTDADIYDAGDMWAGAVYADKTVSYDNDLLVCCVAKAGGIPFSISHWKPASNATTAFLANLGDRILAGATDADKKMEAIEKLANQGISDAKVAYGEALSSMRAATEAYGLAGSASSAANDLRTVTEEHTTAIQATNREITALAGKIGFDAGGNITNISKSGLVTTDYFSTVMTERFNFDTAGNITNISKSGLVTTTQFSGLFAQYTEAGNLVSRSEINVFVTKDEVGRQISMATIDADQINLNGMVVINGSVTSPFKPYNARYTFQDKEYTYDNIFPAEKLTSSGGTVSFWDSDTEAELQWDSSQIGRTICLSHYNNASAVSLGRTKILAPSGKFFFENGFARSRINLSREIMLLKGLGKDGMFWGWAVIGRHDVRTTHLYGDNLKCFAQGIVSGTSNGAAIRFKTTAGIRYWDEQVYNSVTGKYDTVHRKEKVSMTVTRLSIGTYRVSFPSGWNCTSDNYYVMLTGIGHSLDDTTNSAPVKATLKTRASTYFDVWTSDDATVNDASFAFQMFSMADWDIYDDFV